MLRAARAADKALIAEVSVFDVFAGPKAEAQMGAGQEVAGDRRAPAADERTLTEAEIEAVSREGRRRRREGDRRDAARLTRLAAAAAGLGYPRRRHFGRRRRMIKEFREFIARGNVMDLAVGIIIGAAFTAIVNSLVNDLINPLIGLVTGGTDFSNLFVALSTEDSRRSPPPRPAGVAVFRYGSFITAVINFLIIAWVVFLLVKAMNRCAPWSTPPRRPRGARARPRRRC